MTDKPSTLALDANEWRALIGENLSRATQFVQSTQQLSAEHLKAFHDHMDRVKSLITAWHLSAPPAASDAAKQSAPVESAGNVKPNGAVPKRRGRPKGSRNAPSTAVAQ